MCTLIALCLVSQFLVAAFGSRGVKTLFCVFSGGALLLCILIFVMFNVKIDFYPAKRLYGIRGELLAQIPAFLLTIFSASEFTGLIHSLLRRPYVKTNDIDVDTELTNKEYPLVDNERQAGKSVHKDYTIVGKGK